MNRLRSPDLPDVFDERDHLMFLTILIGIAIALLAGLAIKYVLPMFTTDTGGMQITWIEFAVGSAIIALLVVPGVAIAGAHIAKAQKLSYREFWSGYEKSAYLTTNVCTRDGSCVHTYQCDPYIVLVTHYHTDSKGNSYTTEDPETRYHDCPEETEELSYYVKTTLGSTYTIAADIFPSDPAAHEWRSGHGYDSSVPSGVPVFWTAAKQRIDSGNPGPVTEFHSYDNYILASQNSILHAFSGAMNDYLKQGLLPKVQSKVYDYYYADKFYVVGHDVPDHAAWTNAVMRFNAALGSDLQGDLHFVLVNTSKVSDPNNWFGALTAYWESSKLGKHDISKNGIIVAVGTNDGRTIAWAKAATGMPVGNEQMLTDIENTLPGKPLTPQALFGSPRETNPSAAKPGIDHGDGLLAQIVWGPDRFQRICMVCKSQGDKGVGFGYLGSEIQPSTGAKIAVFFIALFFSLIVWAVFAAVGTPAAGTVTRLTRRRTYPY